MKADAPAAAPVWLDRATPPHIVTLVALAGLSALNMNVFLPSLPAMARDLGADYAVIQLAVSGYLAATAALQLFIGPLSDRYGRRRVLVGSLLIFLAASLGCTLAPTVEIFMVFRMISAAVVSGMVLSRAIVRDLAPPDQAASMIGYVTMGMSLAPMVGPMIGGFIGEALGWRANFALLFLLGGGVLALTLADLGETNRARFAGFGAQLAAYPELMRSRRFWGYTAVAAFASGAFFAFLGGAPYVASQVLGMTPAETGFYFGFVALGYAVGNFFSGRFATRVGLNGMIALGGGVAMAGIALAVALFAVTEGGPLALFGPILLLGLGNGVCLPSAMAGSLSVRPHLAGSASGLGGALMIGGGAALAAITGALLGPETGVWPLLWMMGGSSLLALVAVGYVRVVERARGPLPGAERPEGGGL